MIENLVLQELLCNEDAPFRIHTVRVEKFLCQDDLPTLFLTHYDSLSDELKRKHPLSSDLLAQTLNKVSATEACHILNLPLGTIKPQTHIKIVGKIILVIDDLPLALRLTFTNTAKENQTLKGDKVQNLVEQEAKNCQFSGAVDVLYKNKTPHLISLDAQNNQYTITPNDGYVRLPNDHSTATTTALNEFRVLTSKLAHIDTAITSAVMGYYDNLINPTNQ